LCCYICKVREPIIVDLRVESDFHLWLYLLFKTPSFDEDLDYLFEQEEDAADLAILKEKFVTSEIFSPRSQLGYSWNIVEAGIPYESKFGLFLIQAYIECLAQQVFITEEIDSEGLPVVQKLDNWRVIHLITVDNEKQISNFENALVASNRLALSQLRQIPLEKIAGMTYDISTEKITEITGELKEADLNNLVENYAKTVRKDNN
jgi:hypothetical protein